MLCNAKRGLDAFGRERFVDEKTNLKREGRSQFQSVLHFILNVVAILNKLIPPLEFQFSKICDC